MRRCESETPGDTLQVCSFSRAGVTPYKCLSTLLSNYTRNPALKIGVLMSSETLHHPYFLMSFINTLQQLLVSPCSGLSLDTWRGAVLQSVTHCYCILGLLSCIQTTNFEKSCSIRAGLQIELGTEYETAVVLLVPVVHNMVASE